MSETDLRSCVSRSKSSVCKDSYCWICRM